jgi:hypothetical protein
MSLARVAIALSAGAVGALLTPKHRVLAFLDVAAAASNVHAVALGERTWQDAIRRMGRHVVATVGALSVPKSIAAGGYIAGAIAGDMLFDGEGGGIIEELANYEGVVGKKSSRDVIDAEFREVTPSSKALAKVRT